MLWGFLLGVLFMWVVLGIFDSFMAGRAYERGYAMGEHDAVRRIRSW